MRLFNLFITIAIPSESFLRISNESQQTQIIEQTIRAALEIDYPADKLTVLLLDDGGSPGPFPNLSPLTLHTVYSP